MDRNILWWPDTRKEMEALPGSRSMVTLKPGTRISRYSCLEPERDYGWWFEPVDTPKNERLVNPFAKDMKLRVFQVVHPLTVEMSKATPWFDMPGKGIQLQVMDGYENEVGAICRFCVKDLVRFGGIVEVKGDREDEEHAALYQVPNDAIIRTENALSSSPDGIYAYSPTRTIIQLEDGAVKHISSFNSGFMGLQKVLYDYRCGRLSVRDKNAAIILKCMAEGFSCFSDLKNAFDEISTLTGLKISLNATENDLSDWCDGEFSNADQIQTFRQVGESEWQVGYWERGTVTEILRIFGWQHLCEYVLNESCHLVQ